MKKPKRMVIGISMIAVMIMVLAAGYIGMMRRYKEERERALEESPVFQAILKGLGEDVMLSGHGKSRDQTITYYRYRLKRYEEVVITQMEAALNSMANKPQHKIRVVVYDKFHGGEEPTFALKNY